MQEAIELGEKVLESRQKTLGSEQPDTLSSMSKLAIYYNKLGRRQEAIVLTKKILEASQRTLGSEHPNTLAPMDNIANQYSDLGRR